MTGIAEDFAATSACPPAANGKRAIPNQAPPATIKSATIANRIGDRTKPRSGRSAFVTDSARASQQFDEPIFERVEVVSEVAGRTREHQLALGDHTDLRAERPDLLRVVAAEKRRHVVALSKI